ncbi:MAG TPA: Ppx/GppA phosphatase family protein [Bryobacteraceae bacterium]|jgi:exopolyphosphatase/guanosine-5'-triphosphate,3'-diphosphate pyrophosphatase|nr:Ppx/GppA phosphatase family protein [Bryobacteraceae bacterium]
MARYAAVDIGSNSVRMMAADVSHGETRVLAEDRQVTRLGESVFRDGRISKDALDFLCATLARMAAAYSRLEILAMRAVATSAVRDASNQDEFLQRTSSALGTKVEIISGPEEARLIHLGVEARWPRPKERTLIVDVGGGSGELIISQNGQLIDAVSKPLGAVRLTEVFLQSDPPRAEELRRLSGYIEEKLKGFAKEHGSEKFDRAIATSATAAALVCAANQIPRAKREEADRTRASAAQLQEIFEKLAASDLNARRKMTGIGPKRAEIVTAGAAVFLAVLQQFNLRSLYYCAAGVRDGIIADLAARRAGLEQAQLSRDERAVVENMAKRYAVSLRHARHVAYLAQQLFGTLQPVHQLPPAAGKLLEASAYLHDIGHYVSGTSHHKHSAYLVANSDLPGFTDKERLTIAALCRFHRKSMPQPRHSHFQALEADSKRAVLSLAPLLRIADALDRGHEQKVKQVSSVMRDGVLSLVVEGEGDPDLEVWAANEAAEAFQEAYGKALTVQRAKYAMAK